MWSRLTNGHLNLLFFLLYHYKLKENTQDDSLLIRRGLPHHMGKTKTALFKSQRGKEGRSNNLSES